MLHLDTTAAFAPSFLCASQRLSRTSRPAGGLCPVTSCPLRRGACLYSHELLAELVEESIKMLMTCLVQYQSRKSREQCGNDDSSVHKSLEPLVCWGLPETSVGIPCLRCRLDPQDDFLYCRTTPGNVGAQIPDQRPCSPTPKVQHAPLCRKGITPEETNKHLLLVLVAGHTKRVQVVGNGKGGPSGQQRNFGEGTISK